VKTTFEVECQMTKAEADDMSTFLSSIGKEMQVDSVWYDVVSDPANYNVIFDLTRGSNARTTVKLRFYGTEQEV